MNGEKIDPSASPYAKFIMDLLHQKGHGQVMNRSEIVKEIDGVTYFDAPGKFRLETELLVVVLGALIHAGEIVLSIPGKEFAATDLKDFGARHLVELEGFKHIKKPKDWNLPAIKAVFDLLGLPSGLAIQVTQNDSEPLQQLAVEVSKRLDRLVMSKQEFASGLPFWGHQLLTADEITRLATDVDNAKEFLESLQNYKTPGTFKNFRYSAEEIKALEPAFNSLKEVGELKTFADTLAQFTSYLTTAESILPEAHPWREKCQEAKKKLREEVLKSANRESETFRKKTIQSLEKLKSEYITAYLDLYRHARLDQQQDKQKGILLTDYRLEHLKQLASIQSINRSQLIEIQDEFGRLKTGQNLSPSDLIATPTAGEFFPAMEKSADISADQRLKNLKAKMESVHEVWTAALLNDLDDPVTKEHLDLLKPAERKLVDDFKKEKELPDPLPPKLIPALQQALSGLSRVPVSSKKLFEALFPSGTPATIEEIKERFAAFADELVRGQDRSKVRLVLENEEKQ
jgi:hypothetical protein